MPDLARADPEIVVIIPARLASTRFPEKVLAARTGRPLIQHVYEAARRSRRVARAVIAADDARVADAARAFGAPCVLTRPDHPNGTSRLAEAAAALALPPDAIVVNVQGDEPEVEPGAIDAAVDAMTRAGALMGTLASPIRDVADAINPNVVKVVLGVEQQALYFSRAAIPFFRDRSEPSPAGLLRHVGLYVYRRSFLDTYLSLPPTPLEQAEKLEQLRVLEHGYAISVALVDSASPGIDTPEQYNAFVDRWRRAHPQSSRSSG
ncbi:MAG: 3-deoxy-manno-octulosonate cytidylyltransferase [Phycisphaerales bacterium]